MELGFFLAQLSKFGSRTLSVPQYEESVWRERFYLTEGVFPEMVAYFVRLDQSCYSERASQ